MRQPSYIALHRDGTLKRRIGAALERLAECRLCPRKCGVDRAKNETGFCATGRWSMVASYSPHFGEERPLVGRCGSGTIFMSGCNLLCSFCQNYDISHHHLGRPVRPEELAGMMLLLQRRGCHNINFVTPSHVVPQILEALPRAIERGLDVPLVYNSGGYDEVTTLRLLEGVFDIYMPDFKFWSRDASLRFCGISDYRNKAMGAFREMHRQVGDLTIDGNGVAVYGLLVRHLVMPEDVAGTREILGFLSGQLSQGTHVNIMDQYRPCYKATRDPLIDRPINIEELNRAEGWAREMGLYIVS
jgi:putative pyruvate formate lyase activating enzyme